MTQLAEKLANADTATAAGSPAKRGNTIFDLIERQGPQIARALPAHLSAERFVRIALTQVRRTPRLAACDAASLLGAIMQLAQVGLEPDGRNAHLVPFKNEATAIIDYRGYMELARRSGQIADIYAEVVHAADRFEYRLGLHRDIVHEPADGDRGELTHAYAVANFKDGGVAFVVLTKADIERRKASSKTANRSDSMWQTAPEAAWRKTAVRALAPYLPYSPELAAAEAVDNRVEYGTDHTMFGLDHPVIDVDEAPADTPDPGSEPEPDESEAAEPPDGQGDESQPVQAPTQAQMKKLHAALRGIGVEGDDRHPWVSNELGRQVDTLSDLSRDEVSWLIDQFEAGAYETPEAS